MSSSTLNSQLLYYFGGDAVHEIHKGNARIATGAFGDVTLAVYHQEEEEIEIVTQEEQMLSLSADSVANATTDRSGSITTSIAAHTKRTMTKVPTRRIVAVKTLFQAFHIAKPTWGSPGREHQQQKQRETCLLWDVFAEISALLRVNPHPNIASLLAVFPSRDHHDDVDYDDWGINHNNNHNHSPPLHAHGSSIALAFEYAPVDLRLVLEWRRRMRQPLLFFPIIRRIMADLMAALSHCHAQGVVHHDIKPGNLLVSSCGVIQLTDFGLATLSRATSTTTTSTLNHGQHPLPPVEQQPPEGTDDDPIDLRAHPPRGLCTLHYRPPEVLFGGHSEASGDLWSAGTVIAELIAGNPLFPGRSSIEQLLCVLEGVGTPSETHWPNARYLPDFGKLPLAQRSPQPLASLLPRSAECPALERALSHCLALDPAKRSSAAQLMRDNMVVIVGQPPNKMKKTLSDDDSANGTANDLYYYDAVRQDMIRELIPESLDAPALLSGVDATALVLDLAHQRRSILR